MTNIAHEADGQVMALRTDSVTKLLWDRLIFGTSVALKLVTIIRGRKSGGALSEFSINLRKQDLS